MLLLHTCKMYYICAQDVRSACAKQRSGCSVGFTAPLEDAWLFGAKIVL